MVASANWPPRLSKVGKGTQTPCPPCTTTIPSPILGGGWGQDWGGQMGWPGKGLDPGPVAPSAWNIAHTQWSTSAVGTLALPGDSTLALPGRDSCQKGWRLLYILAAYYKCSEVLRPFLLAFLQDASRHPELPFQGIAKACEQNLQKTLQFGGRSLFPSSMELKAMVAGRSAKRQLFLLPGGIERHLKIKTCSVSWRGPQAWEQETWCNPGLW
uniref:Myosin XVA n=1 Tax=Calidris pygmaea TaxID=425635 RepID=A0A8C3J967_9CHAR